LKNSKSEFMANYLGDNSGQYPMPEIDLQQMEANPHGRLPTNES